MNVESWLVALLQQARNYYSQLHLLQKLCVLSYLEMSLTAKLKEEVSENCLIMMAKILNLASLLNCWMMSSLVGICGMTHAQAVTWEWMHVPLVWMWLVPLGWMTSRQNTKDHFTALCLVSWSLNENEAGGDLVLIETSRLFLCKFLLINMRTTSLT